MSFSFSATGHADEVRRHIKACDRHEIPESLREFVLWGINGLKCKFGADVQVSVMARGHLNDDGSTYEISNAEIKVEAVVTEVAAVVVEPAPEPVVEPAATSNDPVAAVGAGDAEPSRAS